jgi:hypothetical protein
MRMAGLPLYDPFDPSPDPPHHSAIEWEGGPWSILTASGPAPCWPR